MKTESEIKAEIERLRNNTFRLGGELQSHKDAVNSLEQEIDSINGKILVLNWTLIDSENVVKVKREDIAKINTSTMAGKVLVTEGARLDPLNAETETPVSTPKEKDIDLEAVHTERTLKVKGVPSYREWLENRQTKVADEE